MKIGIIGGTDGLGKTLISFLKDDFDVAISGRDHTKGNRVAKEFNVTYYKSNTELANDSDVLIISVPINHTNSVIRETADYMKDGSVMIDITSVKEEPSKTMAEVLPDTVEYVPTHPIFGPRTTELDNQVIVLTPIEKGEWYEKIYNYLNNKNMRVIETTAENHDYMMSIVQVLTHFSFISTASTINKLNIDITKTEDYESPIYNLMIDMIARIVSQNPYLTYYIQTMNDNGEKIRNAFAEAVIELKDAINTGDELTFVKIADSATKNMGDIKAALGRSDKAISSLTQEHNELLQLKGHEVGLKDIYTSKTYIGILENIEKDEAILKNDKGLEIVKISNIKILNSAELFEWKINNQKHILEEISCCFNGNINKETIKETISNLKNIIDVSIIKKNSCLTIEIESLSENSIEEVKKLLTGFGGIMNE